MDDKKLITLYLPKSEDDKLRLLAASLSSEEDVISVGMLIAAMIGYQMGNLSGIDNGVLRAYFTLIS